MSESTKYTRKLVYAILAVIPVYLLFASSASALPDYSVATLSVPSVPLVSCSRGMSVRACEAAANQAAAQARANQAAADQARANQAAQQAAAQREATLAAAHQARINQAAAEQRQAAADKKAADQARANLAPAAAQAATISPTLIRYNTPIKPSTTVPPAQNVYGSVGVFTQSAPAEDAPLTTPPKVTSYGKIGVYQGAAPIDEGINNYKRKCTIPIPGNTPNPICDAQDVRDQKAAEQTLILLAKDMVTASNGGQSVTAELTGLSDKLCGAKSTSGKIECKSDNALDRAVVSTADLEKAIKAELVRTGTQATIVIRIEPKTCPSPPAPNTICVVSKQIQDTGDRRDVTATLTTQAPAIPITGDLCPDYPGIQTTADLPCRTNPIVNPVDLCPNDLGIQLTLPCPVPPPTDLCPNDLGIQLTLPCPIPPPDETASSGTPPPAETASSGTPPPVTTPRRIKPS